jgi:hypothetical protein
MGLALVASLIISGATPAPVLAIEKTDKPDVWLQVSPVSNTIELQPGQKYNGQMTVMNIGNLPFSFSMLASPYYVTNLDYQQRFDDKELPRTQIAHWISFDKTDYQNLQPNTSVNITYHINVPKDAPGGGQYAVLFAQTDSGPGNSVQTINRVGSLVYAHVAGDTRQAGEVISVDSSSWYFVPPIKTGSVVKNTGTVDFMTKQTLIVEGLFGGEVYRNSTDDKITMPDTSRRIELTWDKTPIFGIFRVTNQIEFLGKLQYSETQLVIVIPIWLLVIIITVLLLIILAIVLSVRRRLTRRHKTFATFSLKKE